MLNKTIKGSDFDSIFTEVSHSEKLGLISILCSKSAVAVLVRTPSTFIFFR